MDKWQRFFKDRCHSRKKPPALTGFADSSWKRCCTILALI